MPLKSSLPGKAPLRPLLAGALVLCAWGCGLRLDTPERRAGYSIGQSVGRNLVQFKDRLDLSAVDRGMDDEAANTATMGEDAMTEVLQQLQNGQAGDRARTSYAVGMGLARNLREVLPFVDRAMIQRGLRDELDGESKLYDAEMIQALKDLDERRRARDRSDGEAYLARNRALPGVHVTASGLQYQVLRPGSGPKPRANDSVLVDYAGTLTDGDTFDSSYERHRPAVFPLAQVLPGWAEGLEMMRVGSEYRFVLPAKLAYGEKGRAPEIGQDAVLIFEVELLGIEKGKPRP